MEGALGWDEEKEEEREKRYQIRVPELDEVKQPEDIVLRRLSQVLEERRPSSCAGDLKEALHHLLRSSCKECVEELYRVMEASGSEGEPPERRMERASDQPCPHRRNSRNNPSLLTSPQLSLDLPTDILLTTSWDIEDLLTADLRVPSRGAVVFYDSSQTDMAHRK